MPSSDESEFIKKGIGTQQVVTIIQKMFPHASIARADIDTTTNGNMAKNNGSHYEMVILIFWSALKQSQKDTIFRR